MTVQEALDDLYTKITSQSGYTEEQYQAAQATCPSGSICISNSDLGTPQYYAFGNYKGWCSDNDTYCNSYSDFPTTATTPPEGKNVYLGLYADRQYGVCIKRNGEEHCFRGRNYIAESNHIQEVFPDNSCYVDSSHVYCNDSDFFCVVYSDGYVTCDDYGAGSSCDVDADGSVYCG